LMEGKFQTITIKKRRQFGLNTVESQTMFTHF
jgi:hypothetical protein